MIRREALEAAISEKDAHLALLEITGIKTAQQDEQQERLKVDRRRLVQQLKEEVSKPIYYPKTMKNHNFPLYTECSQRIAINRSR